MSSSSSSSSSSSGTLRYYLVEHPTISSFHWDPNHSLLSSRLSLLSTILLYLLLVAFHQPQPQPQPPSPILRVFSSLHNLLLLLLSLLMSLGCGLSSMSLLTPSTLVCLPSSTAPSGPLFFWAHVYYLSKLYELLDTLLILLSNPGRLSFLHVYHHAVVPAMSYLWLSTRQSLFPVALVTNASVHVVMYSYYLSCSLGWRWGTRWKRVVTDLQIAQFVFSFAVSLGFVWLHWTTPGGCSGFAGWTFNAVFNGSLLWLFADFHRKSYGKSNRNKNKRKLVVDGVDKEKRI